MQCGVLQKYMRATNFLRNITLIFHADQIYNYSVSSRIFTPRLP